MNLQTLRHFATRSTLGLIGLLIAVLAGCGNETNSTTPAAAQMSVTLASITVMPASATVSKGEAANLTAIGTFSDGSIVDVTNMATWTATEPAVATARRGIATGTAVGATKITAALNGIDSSPVAITVTAAVLTEISVAPTPISIAKGGTTPLTATGAYSDGTIGNISGSVTWASSNIAAATVAPVE